MAGRNLEYTVEERACLRSTAFKGIINSLAIPACGDSRGEERFHFRSEVKRPFMLRVKERLNTKSIAGGKERPIRLVPKDYGELAPQLVQAVSAQLLIEMKGNFAVGSGPKSMPPLFEFLLGRLVTVEFPVDYDPK